MSQELWTRVMTILWANWEVIFHSFGIGRPSVLDHSIMRSKLNWWGLPQGSCKLAILEPCS